MLLSLHIAISRLGPAPCNNENNKLSKIVAKRPLHRWFLPHFIPTKKFIIIYNKQNGLVPDTIALGDFQKVLDYASTKLVGAFVNIYFGMVFFLREVRLSCH
jgi:hypothetical protein